MPTGGAQAPSYAHGAGAVPLLGETIGANLERTAARVPESEGLVSCHQGARFTWAELNAAVDRLARGLLGLGLEKGDRVGVWSPNRYEWALAQYATAKLGVILVNINPAYRTSELEYALRQSGCRVLVAAPEFKGADYRAMVEEVRDGLPALEQVVFFDSPEWDCARRGRARARTRPSCARGWTSWTSTTRSTSSTRAGPRAGRRAPRSPTTTSSTTRCS